jgi:hypothetical protein
LTSQPTNDPRFPRKPLNGCGGCRQDFTSLRLFDAHRIGAFESGNYQGHIEDWSLELGRRCLDVEEMAERGWEQDEKGRWFDPERVEDARRRLGRVAEAEIAPPGGEATEEADAA